MEGLDSVLLSDQTTHQPIRSVSLPSRIHPIYLKLRTALNRLSIWQRSSSSFSISTSFGSEMILIGLVNLTELYGCIHELLESPYLKHTLLHYQKGKLLDDILDGSIVLLDVCEAAREVIFEMRDHVEDLKSVLRRKGNVEKKINSYVYLRKKVKKDITKHINALKKIETRDVSTNIDQAPLITSTKALRETIEITISIFRHLLLFLSTISPSPARKIKNNIGFLSIPFVSSPLLEKPMDLMKEMKSLEDVFLGYVVGSRRVFVEVEMMKKRDVVGDRFRDLETELDCVFKCLVKNRVMFLNILSNC